MLSGIRRKYKKSRKMKKICIGFLSLLILNGCKNDEKTNEESLINQNNLFIKGDGISKQVVFDTGNTNYDFISYDNDPHFYINFRSKELTPIFYGIIHLDQTTKNSSLETLILDEVGLRCLPLFGCKENTSYDLQSKNGLNFIKINFKDSANFLLKPLDPESYPYEFNQIPVLINGQFSVNAPMSWPIFQTQRFPKYTAQGTFNFDGKTYDVSTINLPRFNYENSELKSKSISIYLESSLDTLHLVVTKRFDISDQYDNVFIEIYNEDFSSSSLPISKESWQDEGNLIALGLNNVMLRDRNSSNVKSLNANIQFPRSHAKLTFNGNKLNIIPVGSSFLAMTENDQKMYQIGTYINNKDAELKIIQELKGHISLKLKVYDSDTFSCGDRDSPCEGITFDEPLKNFIFNNVKLGSENLNGTVYFAGVL